MVSVEGVYSASPGHIVNSQSRKRIEPQVLGTNYQGQSNDGSYERGQPGRLSTVRLVAPYHAWGKLLGYAKEVDK